MKTLLSLFLIVGVITLNSGCATRVVVVDSQADVVRIGKDVVGSGYVWKDGQWELVKSIKYPEGWYAGPMPTK